MLLTKDALIALANELSIPQIEYAKMNREALTRLIALANIEKGNCPTEIADILRFVADKGSPMLAESISKLSDTQTHDAFKQWIASKKENGVRALCFIDRLHPEPVFVTRGRRAHTCVPIHVEIPGINFDGQKLFVDANTSRVPNWEFGRNKFILLDGEIVPAFDTSAENLERLRDFVNGENKLNELTAVTSIIHADNIEEIVKSFPLKFVAFDLVCLSPLFTRLQFLRATCDILGIEMVESPSNGESNLSFFRRIVKNGGEGIILKDPTGAYFFGESRAHKKWIKVKATVGGTDIDNNDGQDGFIIGFQKSYVMLNQVAAAIIGDADGKEIARISSFNTQTKYEMFAEPEKYLGKALTFRSSSTTTAKKKGSHARFVSWRPDK